KLTLLQGQPWVVTLSCTFSPFPSLFEGRKPDCANPAEANVEESEPTLLLNPEDIVLKEPGSSEKTLRTLLRPGDKVSNHYKTTSSEISAVVGAVPSTCYPTYGVPTIRSDLPAPLIRRVSDRRSYGEEGNAYSLLHPTVFAQKGVFERDFFKTRSKQEWLRIHLPTQGTRVRFLVQEDPTCGEQLSRRATAPEPGAAPTRLTS
uniref:EF-hand domain family member B n=1 Tax=Ovis aries TaxID=9940 RepID=A0AC11D0X5_SHEEP